MDGWERRVTDPGQPAQHGQLPTQQAVVLRLSELSRLLDHKTQEIARLDEAAVRAKNAFKREFARTFLTTTGPVDVRKQTAVQETADADLAAELADMHVRSAREAIRTLRDQLDVGRSLGAAARAEFQATGWGQQT